MIASYWFVRTIFLIPTFLSSAGIFKIWSLKGDGIRNIFIKNMEHFIDTHSASRKCIFNLNVLENKQCTHSILQGLKVMEQWSFASGDIFLLFSLIFLCYYFFSPFFGTLIGKSLKSMDIWKMLSWNKLQKQLQVYGSIKFDRVMVEPCEFNSQ